MKRGNENPYIFLKIFKKVRNWPTFYLSAQKNESVYIFWYYFAKIY